MSFLLEISRQNRRPLAITDRHRKAWTADPAEAQRRFTLLVDTIREATPVWRSTRSKEVEHLLRHTIDLVRVTLEAWQPNTRSN